MLFHNDNAVHFGIGSLRWHAAKMIRDTILVRSAGDGQLETIQKMKIGFWPFVRRFEHAIDAHVMPRKPLVDRFGRAKVLEVFTGLVQEVREMKEEEGSHAAHWVKDARGVGLGELGDRIVPEVQNLIDMVFTNDHSAFFAMLAGTEYAAEELSRFLLEAPSFLAKFDRKRWVWGEIHLAPHGDKPSHLEIDLDLARAYAPITTGRVIRQKVIETIYQFGKAADDIYHSLGEVHV